MTDFHLHVITLSVCFSMHLYQIHQHFCYKWITKSKKWPLPEIRETGWKAGACFFTFIFQCPYWAVLGIILVVFFSQNLIILICKSNIININWTFLKRNPFKQNTILANLVWNRRRGQISCFRFDPPDSQSGPQMVTLTVFLCSEGIIIVWVRFHLQWSGFNILAKLLACLQPLRPQLTLFLWWWRVI